MIQEILEMLKNVETFTITYIYNSLNNVIYKLQKSSSKNINYVLIEAPKLDTNINNADIEKIKEPYNKTVATFVQTLKENLPESSLQAMYHNLKNLKINKSIFLLSYRSIAGMYISFFNRIILTKTSRGDATLTHELLHMSSFIIGKNNISGGFATGNVGRNLDEGYTELLNNRFFGHPTPKSTPYNIYAKIANIVEDIIGKEQMTNSYFNADLKTVFDQLSKYSSNEKTSLFLKDLDSLYKPKITFNNIYMVFGSTRFKRIINYLTDTTMNYIDYMTKNNLLTPDEAKTFLDNYKEQIITINSEIDQMIKKKTNNETKDNRLIENKQK